MLCDVILWRVRLTIFAVKKTLGVTYYEFVSVALAIQHAKRVRHILLRSVASPAVP
jgi:hypothetical protein